MDRRPLLAARFAKAILEEGSRDEDRMVAIILEHWTSDSIPFPGHEWVYTEDPGVINAFLEKYPQLKPIIQLHQSQGRKMFGPETTFSFGVHSDPEGCHVCYEGQHLTMHIHTGFDCYIEGEFSPLSPYWEAHQQWENWVVSEEVPELFHTELALPRKRRVPGESNFLRRK